LEEVWTAALNAFLDDMKLKATPVYKRRVWLNPLTTQNAEIDIRPGDTILVEDPNDLLVMELGRLNYDIQNLYQFLLSEAMMIAGVNDIVMGWPLMKVDRSATSASGRVEAFKARALTFFDSINRSLWKIAEFWLAMIVAYNKWTKFVYKVFDENEKRTVFNKINLEDITWQFDIIFDTQALKSALRDIALQKKLNFLQIASQLAVDPITQQPLVNLGKLVQEIWYDMDVPDVLYKKWEFEKQQQQSQEPTQPQQQPTPKNNTVDNIPPQEEWWEPQTDEAQIAKQLLQQALNPNR